MPPAVGNKHMHHAAQQPKPLELFQALACRKGCCWCAKSASLRRPRRLLLWLDSIQQEDGTRCAARV